ncbi:MAG: ComF family protein [Chloroflexi bacterium]|nr:ComF family protein [Chloroflexota bacterium]MBI3341043.1 ComF family protein [Chloroflexota bacterium]
MPVSSPAYSAYRLLWSGLDLLFPPVCGGCGQTGSRWCGNCQQSLPKLSEPVCDVCGVPLEAAGLCADCQRARPRFNALRSWSAFDAPVRNALHRLKYRRDIGLGDALAVHLSEYVAGLNWPINVVVPVPLGRGRSHERGYNQVGLIARPLSLALRLAYVPGALMRTRETRSQVGLTKNQRRDNVSGAFRADGQLVKNKVVLLMDDVATTGSTLSSCAEALYAAGAQDVFALTVSRALTRHGLHSA